MVSWPCCNAAFLPDMQKHIPEICTSWQMSTGVFIEDAEAGRKAEVQLSASSLQSWPSQLLFNGFTISMPVALKVGKIIPREVEYLGDVHICYQICNCRQPQTCAFPMAAWSIKMRTSTCTDWCATCASLHNKLHTLTTKLRDKTCRR